MKAETLASLTWQDIKTIVSVANDLTDEMEKGNIAINSEETYYEMVRATLSAKIILDTAHELGIQKLKPGEHSDTPLLPILGRHLKKD